MDYYRLYKLIISFKSILIPLIKERLFYINFFLREMAAHEDTNLLIELA